MGYFSNGLKAMEYEARYCAKCLHGQDPGHGNSECAVWMAHFIHNYDEVNNPQSILHDLIPLTADGLENERCAMFLEAKVDAR